MRIPYYVILNVIVHNVRLDENDIFLSGIMLSHVIHAPHCVRLTFHYRVSRNKTHRVSKIKLPTKFFSFPFFLQIKFKILNFSFTSSSHHQSTLGRRVICNKQFLLLHNVLQHAFNVNINSTILV